MGLDLVVEGCAKPGHESEWRRLLELSFAGESPSEQEIARFGEISTPGYERIGAPRVGYDRAADAWIVETRKPRNAEETAELLKDFHGYHALPLVECDGVPKYSHGGLYDGVDETSFRGSFLTACRDVLSGELIEDAWNSKLPEAAISYGRTLLAAADGAEASGPPPKPRRTLLSRLGLAKTPEPAPFEEQLDIVRTAGRWFIFWGERGHAIRAWF